MINKDLQNENDEVRVCATGLDRRQCPKRRCFISGGAEEGELRRVPATGYDFVLVLSYHHAR